LAVIFIYVAVAVVVAGLFFFFLPSLVSDISDLLAKLPKYIDTASVWNPLKGSLLPSAKGVTESLGIANESFSVSEFINGISATVNTSDGFFRALSGVF